MSWFGCVACKAGIGATVAGIAAVCIAAFMASDGAAGAAEPELAGAGGAVLAAETGLSRAALAKIFAAAFAAGGAAEFVPECISRICSATGACS